MTNVNQAGGLYDTLSVEHDNNLKLPAWTDEVYPDPLYGVRVRQFRLSTETDYMKRIKGGPLVTDIHDKMLQFQNGSSAVNLITYAAHDSTISNVLTSMHIVGQTNPLVAYGALLAFELYGDGHRHHENTVQVSDCFCVEVKINDLPSIIY